MGGRGASSATAKATVLALPPANLSDWTKDAAAMANITSLLRNGGQYAPWSSQELTDAEIQKTIGYWKSSSSYVRHNVQYKGGKTSRTSQGFDDWANGGSYGKTIYRGTRMTDKDFAKVQALKKGDYINQNGPASFSKSRSVANHFAQNGYNVGNHPVVFVLQGGTKSGRDISGVHGFANEKEVIVGSASNLRVTKTTVRNGTLYVYGREEKFQYVPHTTH